MYRKIQLQFTPRCSRLLCINSAASQETEFFQHLWNSFVFKYPHFHGENGPQTASSSSSPNTPYEVFQMSLQNTHHMQKLCYDLYTLELIPELERRIDALSKFVSEHRKGVKNVLRSFWRKPAETSHVQNKGSNVNSPSAFTASKNGTPAASEETVVRYRFDSLEGQTLLLADTFFILKVKC